jgi:flagellar motor switch protein FliN/FliY
MSTAASGQVHFESSENIRLVVDEWLENLAQVLQSMTDQRPEARWRAATGHMADVGIPTGPGSGNEILWWEQPFHLAPEMVVWVAAPRATWEYAGTLTLKAAGLETIAAEEIRNTWFEILGQSLSAMGRSIGSVLGREVTCDAGVERAPDTDAREWASVSLSFADASLAPLLLTFSSKLASILHSPEPAVDRSSQEISHQTQPVHETLTEPRPRTMDLLLDVDLPVSISFGRAQLPLKDVLKLTTGSIVELNRGVHDQVEVLVNQCLVARGEVVVVEGNYGVRIQEIVSRQDRLRSLR